MIYKLTYLFKILFAQNRDYKSIIPEDSITKNALAIVIAIMTFIGSLAIGAVHYLNQTAHNWEQQLVKEATIQIKPLKNSNIEQKLKEAAALVSSFPSVQYTKIITQEDTANLLKPWLGDNIDFKNLPIPRLIIVHFFKNSKPEYDKINKAITSKIPGSRFDNHQIFVQHIADIIKITNIIALTIISLVITALSLTVIFATRAALSTNAHIIEVLHFIGTDSNYIARQFDIHFFRTALKGALIGGLVAIALFFIFSIWNDSFLNSLEGKQIAALLGNFHFAWFNYLSLAILIIFISMLTMATSHFTVLKQLYNIDKKPHDLF